GPHGGVKRAIPWQQKSPLSRWRKGLTRVRTLSSASASPREGASASELAPASVWTGCCGFAGPGPSATLDKAMFYPSPGDGANLKRRIVSTTLRAVAGPDPAG